jgi:hypothetical protein
MTITYKTPWPELSQVKMPVLHKVKYAETVDHVQAQYQRSYLDHLVDSWLKDNCRSPYYHSPGYLQEKSIHFEDDDEAMMFALRWS